MSERIPRLAWQEPGLAGVSRGTSHVYEDARLMADELDREYPDIYHWAAPATDVELRLHAAQAARGPWPVSLKRNRRRSRTRFLHKGWAGAKPPASALTFEGTASAFGEGFWSG